HAIAAHLARIANLSAALAVERRLVHHHRAALAFFEFRYFLAVLYQRGHHAFGAFGLVAEELRRAGFLAQRKPNGFGCRLAGARPRRARLGALAIHGVGERGDVDADAAR